jgi:peptidylprolyl isomerase
VIDEVTFASNLNIDLSSMELLPSGLYILDVVVGDGDEVVIGTTPSVTYTGWLSDGTMFDSNTDLAFVVGNHGVVLGFEEGVLGMLVGGTRRIIIPPHLGYGSQARGSIPAGSILIFDLTVDSVS